MDYVITFSNVMAGVIALGGSVLAFFIRSWFNKLSENTEEIKKQIKEMMRKSIRESTNWKTKRMER